MKLYIKSAVYDRRGENLKKENRERSIQIKEDEIKRLVEQGISKSEFAGHEISKFEIDGNSIKFELDGVGSPKGYYLTTDVYFRRSELDKIPQAVSKELDRKFFIGDLKPIDEMNRIHELVNKAQDDIRNLIDALMIKYDADGDLSFNDNYVYYTSDGEPGIFFSISFDKFLGIPHDTFSFEYQGYDFYYNIDRKNKEWLLEEPYEYNKSAVTEGFEKLANDLSRWKTIIDNIDVDKFADDIEYQLKSFESKYKSRFPGLEISNLEVHAIVPDTGRFLSFSKNYKFSFDLEAYDGEIDITVKMTLDDLKGKTLEDRLLNIIKYRKRKYGLR